MSHLEGRVVLVTGAGQGIGRGICVAIAEAGGHVMATDLDGEAADRTVHALRAAGGRAEGFTADVTVDQDVDAAVGATIEAFGGLDALVNNAGVLRMGPALDRGLEDWPPQMRVNARAVLGCARRVAASFIERGVAGSIVNVASNAGKVGYPNMAVYNASKAAVISLTRSLAAEWAERDINVNAVCPGGVDTPMLGDVARWIADRSGATEEELLAQMVPAQLGRLVEPVEVGRVVAFLLSDDARIIRGQAINVDGGDTPY